MIPCETKLSCFDAIAKEFLLIHIHFLLFIPQTDKAGYAFFIVKTTDIKLSQKEYISTIELSAEVEEEGTGIRKWKIQCYIWTCKFNSIFSFYFTVPF